MGAGPPGTPSLRKPAPIDHGLAAGNQAQAVVSQPGAHTQPPARFAEAERGTPFVSGHDLRAAMSKDRAGHALVAAPFELRQYGCVPDETFGLLAQYGAGGRRAIADVKSHAAERARALWDRSHIRNIENAAADPKAHRRRSRRMFHRERFESDRPNGKALPGVNGAPFSNWVAFQDFLSAGGCKDRTRSSCFKSRRMIGVRVRQQNGRRRDAPEPLSPVGAAIDHHLTIARGDQQRTVHGVAPGACFNLAARA